MKPLSIAVVIIISLFSACTQTATPSTPMATAAVVHPATLISQSSPSPRAIPSATPIVVPTITSAPTAMPSPTQPSSPTPSPLFSSQQIITTPEAEANHYRLRSLSDAEMLRLIQTAQENIDNHVIEPYGSLDYANLIVLSRKEILRRFPNLNNWSDLYRDLVFDANSMPVPDPFLFDDFLSLVEQKLNSGEDNNPIKDLQDSLEDYHFIITQYEAPNLFGDGEWIELLHLDAYENGTMIAITKSEENQYHVIPIREGWLAYYRGKEVVSVSDHNGNGQPEIVSIVTISGHAGCYSEISILEWDKNGVKGEFQNLASEIEEAWGNYVNNDCRDVWIFEGADSTQAPSLVQLKSSINWADQACLPYQIRVRYRWTNKGYQQEDIIPVPFDTAQPLECAIGWADVASEGESKNEAIAVLSKTLEEWSSELNEKWGSSSENYWRFKLSTWYADQGQIELAEKNLNLVQDKTSKAKDNIVFQLAAVYLDEYQQERNPDKACQAAIETAYSTLPDQPDLSEGNGWVIGEMKRIWGFAEPDWNNFDYRNIFSLPLAICDTDFIPPKDRIEQLIDEAGSTSETKLIQLLQENDISVEELVSDDTTDDGEKDSIVLITDHKFKYQQIWVLLNSPDTFTASPLIYSSTFGFFSESAVSPTLRNVLLDEALPLFTFFSQGDSLIIFWVDEHLQVQVLGHWYGQYTLNPSTIPPELTVDGPAGEVTYIWNSDEQEFSRKDIVFVKRKWALPHFV